VQDIDLLFSRVRGILFEHGLVKQSPWDSIRAWVSNVCHAKWPLPLSLTVFGVPVLFLPRGRQQASAESGVSSCSLSAVSTDTRFSHMRSPTALSDIVSLCGRTGHLRRTVRNPLRSDRFLLLGRAACSLKHLVGNSGQPFERWTVARGDGAYPRPERRGIAPGPRITPGARNSAVITLTHVPNESIRVSYRPLLWSSPSSASRSPSGIRENGFSA
jgi:hypothetical protein